MIAPGMAMLLNVTGVAAVAGGSTPLAFLLGGIACLALAFVVIGFTRRMAAAGYAYTYTSRSLGKEAGFMAGWLYFFGFICFVPMTMSGVGYLAADLLGLNPKLWILFFFIGMALFLVLSTIRIKVTTRVQLIVGIVTVAIILIVDLVTTAKGGSHGQALSAFSFSHSNSRAASAACSTGSSSASRPTSASRPPPTSARRPRTRGATSRSRSSWRRGSRSSSTCGPRTRSTIGFGVNNGAKFGADPVALKTTATTYVGPWLGTLVEIGGMCAAFIVCVACATAAARTLFSMGREGVLPAAFAPDPPAVQDPGQRHARGHRGGHRDGPADGLPVLGRRVRRAVQQLLLLGHRGHAADHRRVHHAVHRRHRVLLADPRYAEVEPDGARGGPGGRRGGLRRGAVRLGAPDAAGHPQVDAVRGRGLAGPRRRGAALAAGAAARTSVAQIGSILGEEGGAEAAVLDK